MNHCIWIYGEAKAGKSTTCYNLLQKKLRNYIIIDGDAFRRHMDNKDLKFSREDIIENNKRALKMVKELLSKGWDVLVAMITPYKEMREEIKKELGSQVLLVELQASERCRETRLNYRASAIEFEQGNADLSYNSEDYSQDFVRDRILDELKARGWIN
jgi:adenylylsulfate kinase-like enzyme